MERERHYPDNSGIYAQKARVRRERAALSFAEKLDALDRLKEAANSFARSRDARSR